MLDSAALLARIKDTFTREEFPAKSLLVKEGALAKKLFYIESGGCRGWFRTSAGKEVTINFGFEGSFVSSMETLLSAQPSWYSVETLEPTVAYSIPLREFQALKATPGAWQAAYVEYLESRLLHYQQLFISRLKDNPATRYRALLSHHPELIRRVPSTTSPLFSALLPFRSAASATASENLTIVIAGRPLARLFCRTNTRRP